MTWRKLLLWFYMLLILVSLVMASLLNFTGGLSSSPTPTLNMTDFNPITSFIDNRTPTPNWTDFNPFVNFSNNNDKE